jgi:hypothetical protein
VAEKSVEWFTPAILIAATAVVLVLCTRAVVRALRADKAQKKDRGAARKDRE